MADPVKLRRWVDDRLQDILGYSEPAVATYIIALAKRATSSSQIAGELEQHGLPKGPSTSEFAADLFSKMPRQQQASKVSAQREREVEAARLARANENSLLVDDDDGLDQLFRPAVDKKKKRSKKKDKNGSGGDGGGGEVNLEGYGRAKRKWEEEEEAGIDEDRRAAEEEAAREAAREEDRRERDKFAERLRKKDDAKTMNVAEPKLTHAERMEEERRRYETEAEKEDLVDRLRVVSRREYLKKREEAKLRELEEELEDEDRMFPDKSVLSTKEQAEYEYKRKTLALAKQRLALEAQMDEDEYTMPEWYDEPGKERLDKKEAVLYERYKENAEEKDFTPWQEQERWEEAQIRRANQKAGAAREKKADELEQFVFDNEVQFVLGQTIDEDDDGESEEEEDEADKRKKARHSEQEAIQAERKKLPVYPYKDEFLQAVEQHQTLVIVAETGAGKTTQLPQYLHEAGYSKVGKIGCTQPRRVAAMSVAARVSHEMGTKLGREVGYSIRFEDCTSDKTVIKYMTDGMLLREFLSEPDLAGYSVMMIDEAHERTLHTDVLFGLMKDIARYRPDLKLLISSATLDAEKFSDYFDDAPRFQIPGRRYPVDILYTKAPEANYIDAAVVTVLQIHVTQSAGDILVFLTGQEEIETAEELLKERLKGKGSKVGELIVCPIYANLPSDQQAKIFEPTPPGARKVVIATNIAETSLTIDGIRYVIDPGFAKINAFAPRSGMESLQVAPISKASANQRAGRAGRTAPGKCFRLYTAWSYQHELEDNTPPEIQRTNLGNVVLMLKSLGIDNLLEFEFMDPPPVETLQKALEQLYALGALNDMGELTRLGRRMAEFPLDPMLAKVLLASEQHGVSEDIATICAMVTTGAAIFYKPKDKAVLADTAMANFHRGNVGDHVALLTVYNQWAEGGHGTQWCYENFIQVRAMKRARDIRDQLLGLMERVEIPITSNEGDHDAIKKSILAGMFYHVAKLQKDGSYRTIKNPHTVFIHPSSGLAKVQPPPRWVVYHELVLTSKEFMRQVSEIQPGWLVEIAPHYYSKKDVAEEVKKKGKGKAQIGS